MTFRTLALATALTSLSALAAYAEGEGAERQTQTTGVDAIQESDTSMQSNGSTSTSEAAISADGAVTAPTDLDLESKGLRESGTTVIDNVLAEAETGATISSVDDEIIGEVVAHDGDQSAEHLVYVDVDADAGLAVDRIAFQAGTLSVEETGDGLEYAMTLEQLRSAVAAKVATQTQ